MGGLPKNCSMRWIKSAKEERSCSHALPSMMIIFIAFFGIKLHLFNEVSECNRSRLPFLLEVKVGV